MVVVRLFLLLGQKACMYMGSALKNLSRSLYKRTYLVALGSRFVCSTRGVTQLGLVNPLVGARIALAWR